jgi:hypothetical protein
MTHREYLPGPIVPDPTRVEVVQAPTAPSTARFGMASTESAAVRIATICGWPVDLQQGDRLVRGLRGPQDVRDAYLALVGPSRDPAVAVYVGAQ